MLRDLTFLNPMEITYLHNSLKQCHNCIGAGAHTRLVVIVFRKKARIFIRGFEQTKLHNTDNFFFLHK